MKGGPSRRLLIGLTLLLMDSNSILYSTYYDIFHRIQPPQPYETIPDQQVVWLIDEEQMCFGPYGFNSCGETNAWNLHHIYGEQYWLEPYVETGISRSKTNVGISNPSSIDYLSVRKTNQLDKPIPVVENSQQQQLGRKNKWRYNAEGGALSIDIFDVIDEEMESFCMMRDNYENTVLNPCVSGYTRLDSVRYPIVSSSPPPPSKSNKKSKKSNQNSRNGNNNFNTNGLITTGSWQDPVTKLILPRSIILESDVKPQIFVGAGVYTKTVFGMNFKVFTLGWYLEPEAARKDPLLLPYKAMSSDELELNKPFFDAIISEEATYDRSLLIKLAMTLKCELMIQGLIDELDMTERNKALLVEANSRYPAKDCEKGLELLLTWRQKKSPETNNVKESSFEIRVNNQVLAKIAEPTMGRDFMRHFVSDEPVSPPAKKSLAESFSMVMITPTLTSTTIAMEDENSMEYYEDLNDKQSKSNGIKQVFGKFINKIKQSISKLKRFLPRSLLKNSKLPLPQQYQLEQEEPDSDYYDAEDDSYSTFSWNGTPYYDQLSNNPTWNKIYGRIFEKIDKLEKIWHHISRVSSNRFVRTKLTWTPWLYKLLFQQKPYHYKLDRIKSTSNLASRRSRVRAFLYKYGSSFAVETTLSLCVLLYFCLLIVISLPPALLNKGASTLRRAVRGGIGAVRAVKQKSLQHVRSAMLSTQSLANMVRNRSSESLLKAIID